MNIGFLYSRIRKDEKLLLNELRDRGHEVTKIDIRKQQFGLEGLQADSQSIEDLDIILDRCMSTSRGIYAAKMYESYGIEVINGSEVAELCADKLDTSLALENSGVPTPRTEICFTEETALDIIERMGYPSVIKPVTGSWGRLLAKVDTRASAEAILEHKSTLGNYEHSIFYIQEYVDKPGRDIRVLALDGRAVASITRNADHWITNTSQGAESKAIDLDEEAEEIVREASEAVGGGFLGIDMMETEDGYTVHEVNHGSEFKNIHRVTDVDVPAEIISWIESKVER